MYISYHKIDLCRRNHRCMDTIKISWLHLRTDSVKKKKKPHKKNTKKKHFALIEKAPQGAFFQMHFTLEAKSAKGLVPCTLGALLTTLNKKINYKCSVNSLHFFWQFT